MLINYSLYLPDMNRNVETCLANLKSLSCFFKSLLLYNLTFPLHETGLLNTTRHHGKEMVCWLGMQYYSNKQIHESSHYLSYFPWEGQSSHANLCSDHSLAPGHSWPCDLPHKYHHHPLQKHQHQMPKCGYSGGNFLPHFVLSLKGSLQYPVQFTNEKTLDSAIFWSTLSIRRGTWNDLFCSQVDDGNTWQIWQEIFHQFFSPNCSCQANSRTYVHLLQATQYGIIFHNCREERYIYF